MAFFSPENFSMLPNQKDREIAAKVANEVIDKKGTPVCGRVLKDGTFLNFTTDNKQPLDTHVAIAVGVRPMLEFAPTEVIQKEEINQKDRMDALARYVGQLENENDNLRKKGAGHV